MIAILQRVKNASVLVNNEIYSSIEKGLLIFIGIHVNDDQAKSDILVKKIIGLRIFEDQDGKMNLSNEDVKGEYLIVSQFTLLADTSKGKRPGFENAMRPPKSKELYEYFCSAIQKSSHCKLKTGKFGENMLIKIENDGPATFIIDV